MKTKKIIKALKVIKEYCKNCDKCTNCVFNVGNNVIVCGIHDMSPNNWDIKKIKRNLKGIEEL